MNRQVFKRKLLDEKQRLERDIALTRPVIGEGHVGYGTHQADDASDVTEQTMNETVREQLAWLLTEVEHALTKLERGEYGLCEQCGKPIGEGRLDVLPSARLCMEDQSKRERRANSS
jgi:DnaK suppressor protein